MAGKLRIENRTAEPTSGPFDFLTTISGITGAYAAENISYALESWLVGATTYAFKAEKSPDGKSYILKVLPEA